MPARVFAYILAGNQETYTARDFAEGLQASPAAVSGAMRYLADTRLVVKERAPRSRGDLFRLGDNDVWATIVRARLPLLEHMQAAIGEAITLLEKQPPGETHLGLARLRETWEFFEFARTDLSGMLERWTRWKAERIAAGEAQVSPA